MTNTQGAFQQQVIWLLGGVKVKEVYELKNT